jgi:hypothetical protein
MSQNFTADWYAQSYNAATAFGQAEENDNSLKSLFSGASAPSNAVAGMPWYHTSKGLRIRNAANSAWLKVLQGDATTKTWFYRNDTAEGWLVDTSVTDKVLAIKGGTGLYNITPPNTAGSWDSSVGLTNGNDSADHTHTTPAHAHSSTTAEVLPYQAGEIAGPIDVVTAVTGGGSDTTGGKSAVHQHAISSTSAGRPFAAVGTLQYPDLV